MISKRKFTLLFVFILILGGGFVLQTLVNPSSAANPPQTDLVFHQPGNASVMDGIVSNEEYAHHLVVDGGNYDIFWSVVNESVYMALVVNTQGFVGIGFAPERRMLNADMVIGWVTASDQVEVFDCFSTGETGPHPEDTDLGGTSDLISYNGTSNATHTTLEFSRLLAATDTYDRSIPANDSLTIIWAHGSAESLTGSHTRRGAAVLHTGGITDGGVLGTSIPPLWPFHATAMVVGLLLMLGGFIVARQKTQRKNWMKLHHRFVIPGGLLTATGLVIGLVMVQLHSGVHFKVPHALLGIVTLFTIFLTPLLAYLAPRNRTHARRLFTLHRWLGRIMYILMLIVMISGLFIVFMGL
ncbi:MAG: cytochrome and DOMON domain-containing protein [Candidatus Ranarchaeia archaeon]|jgi:hypothetical protein